MLNLSRQRSMKQLGLPPGSVVYTGEQRVDRPVIAVIDYNEAEVNQRAVSTPEECRQYLDSSSVTWVNFSGLHDTALLQRMGEVFRLHPLTLEDVVNLGQRHKLEDLGDYLFLVLKMLYRSASGDNVLAEQVSIILGPNYVLSFQEVEGNVFDLVRDRIRTAKGRIRKMGCDYLAYSLLDAIVDNYFVVVEEMGERVESLQEDVLAAPTPPTMQRIHRLRAETIVLRKNVWPLRELVSSLEKSESALIGESIGPYLRDVYEHTIQVIDTVESMRDTLSGTLDLYMSAMSNRMNDIMRVLTVIATIFIPLTFIAGVYGMNFERIPELRWRFGYLGVWIVMAGIAAGMLLFFRRWGWLQAPRERGAARRAAKRPVLRGPMNE